MSRHWQFRNYFKVMDVLRCSNKRYSMSWSQVRWCLLCEYTNIKYCTSEVIVTWNSIRFNMHNKLPVAFILAITKMFVKQVASSIAQGRRDLNFFQHWATF